METQIATWFVADTSEEATYFPQVGARSDCSEAQAVYWRCAAVFFASSLAVNPSNRHVFYTNCNLPVVDGIDLAELFARWNVEVINLPVTFRLQNGSVDSWGNQFYVFDILKHFKESQEDEQLVLLDSDCLWLEPVDTLSQAIAEHGALTYPLGPDEHPEGEPINGLSREEMAAFAACYGNIDRTRIEYCGGEIIAVTRAMSGKIVGHLDALWPEIVNGKANAPREEAHLLSVIYALEDIEMGSADRFIRRMWTTFRHNNLAPADRWLSIWHLPAEKRTGFTDIFQRIVTNPDCDPRTDPQRLGLNFESYCKAMGWPHRGPLKFVRDLSLKLREKFQ